MRISPIGRLVAAISACAGPPKQNASASAPAHPFLIMAFKVKNNNTAWTECSNNRSESVSFVNLCEDCGRNSGLRVDISRKRVKAGPGFFSKSLWNMRRRNQAGLSTTTGQPPKSMKQLKRLALLVRASSVLFTGCQTCNNGKSDAAQSSCGHKCGSDAHEDCAHWPVCLAKK